MKVTVLAGGTSTERDVSLVTSVKVCTALRKLGHKANVIDVFFGSDIYTDADGYRRKFGIAVIGNRNTCDILGRT